MWRRWGNAFLNRWCLTTVDFICWSRRVLTFIYSIHLKCCVCGGSWRGLRWDLKESRQCWSWHPKASSCHLSSMQCFVGGRGSYQKEPALGNSKSLDVTKKNKTMWRVWYHLYQKWTFNIWIPHFREPLFDCLKDVDLIPPFNRMLLEVTFGKLYSWAVHNIRDILLEASARFKELGEWLVNMFPHVQYQQKCHTLANLLPNCVWTRCTACPSTDNHQWKPSRPKSRHHSTSALPSVHDTHVVSETWVQQPQPPAQFWHTGPHTEYTSPDRWILSPLENYICKHLSMQSFHCLFSPFQAPVLTAPRRIWAYVD